MPRRSSARTGNRARSGARTTVTSCAAFVFAALAGAAMAVQKTPAPVSSPNALMATAQAAIDHGDYSAAVTDLKPLTRSYPKYAPAWFELGYAYTALHQNDLALSAYWQAAALDPKLYQARLNLGILLIEMKRPVEALTEFKQAAALRPEDSRPHLYAGRADEQTGDVAAAKLEFGTAARLKPDSPEASLELGQLDLTQKDFAGARDAFEKAAALDPKLSAAQLGAGIALANLNQGAQAAPYFQRYLAANPADDARQFEFARAELQLHDYAKALAALTEIERRNPRFPGLNGALGETYALLGQFPSSEKYYRLAVTAEPGQAEFHRGLAETLMRERQYSAAEAEFRAALKLNPASRDSARGLAASLCFEQKYPQALPLLEQLVQSPSPAATDYLLLGLSFDHLRQPKPAIEAYQQFLALSHGRHPDQEWQAEQQIKVLRRELGR